jgi:transposase
MLQPVRRRTWAPTGRTPLQYSWDRHDRLSPVSAITLSPIRRRLGLYFRIHSHNIRAEQVVEFLRALRRHLRRKFILILDRYSVHRKAVRLLGEEHPDWFEAEWLPPYASELNPVEQVWNHSKHCDLPNFIPQDVDHLHEELSSSISEQRAKGDLLASYLEFAELKL